ncbi:MAG: DUF2064 domain-containing protein, partial [Candidatus Zixiibacteriota bacterium]
ENLLAGHEKGILFGADIPDLTLEHVLDAAATLDSCDVVFGPTREGGYSLIGMKEMHTEFFEGITWSSSKTLAESLAVCRRLGYSYQMLEELADLDTFEDFSYITWRPRSVKLPGADAQ